MLCILLYTEETRAYVRAPSYRSFQVNQSMLVLDSNINSPNTRFLAVTLLQRDKTTSGLVLNASLSFFPWTCAFFHTAGHNHNYVALLMLEGKKSHKGKMCPTVNSPWWQDRVPEKAQSHLCCTGWTLFRSAHNTIAIHWGNWLSQSHWRPTGINQSLGNQRKGAPHQTLHTVETEKKMVSQVISTAVLKIHREVHESQEWNPGVCLYKLYVKSQVAVGTQSCRSFLKWMDSKGFQARILLAEPSWPKMLTCLIIIL